MQAIFRFFFVYLTSRASDTLKVQTDYLTFSNLITTSDTPKVQPSEAIAVEEYLLKLYAAIIIVFFSFKQDTSPGLGCSKKLKFKVRLSVKSDLASSPT